MSSSVPLQLRLDAALLERVDARRASIRDRAGVHITRAEVIRSLLRTGLNAEDAKRDGR